MGNERHWGKATALKKVFVLVEGQTEANFTAIVLRPYLMPKGIYLIEIIMPTRQVTGGTNFRGGIVSYGKVKHQIQKLRRDSSAALITTMFDFYGIPADFPGYHGMSGNCYEKVHFLESAFKADIQDNRFLPYFSLHEFEALLFADVRWFITAFPESQKIIQTELLPIREKFHSPEEIDDKTPPSKRILSVIPHYEKILHGPLIAAEIGVEKIRGECPHFAAWITQVEAI